MCTLYTHNRVKLKTNPNEKKNNRHKIILKSPYKKKRFLLKYKHVLKRMTLFNTWKVCFLIDNLNSLRCN